MEAQRLRNLTTKRLHTDIAHVYEDIEYLVGERGLMTHCIPSAMRALEPHLRETVPDARYWDESYDPTHTGEIDLQPLTAEQRELFWQRFNAQ
jgi:hypothetical protein